MLFYFGTLLQLCLLLNQNQNQKSFKCSADREICLLQQRQNIRLQEQKHITRTETIAKIRNTIKKGRNRIDIYTYLHDIVQN